MQCYFWEARHFYTYVGIEYNILKDINPDFGSSILAIVIYIMMNTLILENSSNIGLLICYNWKNETKGRDLWNSIKDRKKTHEK